MNEYNNVLFRMNSEIQYILYTLVSKGATLCGIHFWAGSSFFNDIEQ